MARYLTETDLQLDRGSSDWGLSKSPEAGAIGQAEGDCALLHPQGTAARLAGPLSPVSPAQNEQTSTLSGVLCPLDSSCPLLLLP